MNRIKILRENYRMTQQELADKLNCAKSTIAMYENETRTPSVKVLNKLADIFGVTTDYLLGKETELDNISVAFSSITEGLSKEQVDDVKRYIEFLKSKEK